MATVASFSGLRRFLQGRGFKQWTGDDSKALMKVHFCLPQSVVHQITGYLWGFLARIKLKNKLKRV